MPDASVLLVLLLVATLVAVALLVVLLLRRPDAALDALRERLAATLRDEQRDGRAELRGQLDSLSAAQSLAFTGQRPVILTTPARVTVGDLGIG